MKSILVFIFLLALCVPDITLAVIQESNHDMFHVFHIESPDSSANAVCTFCHHVLGGTTEETPLWEATTDKKDQGTATGYNLYDNGNGTFICLSCHDNTLARNIFEDRSEHEHPSNFNYIKRREEALINRRDQKNPLPQYNRGIDGVQGLVTGAEYPMKGGYMHCVTCHDPHEGAQTGPQFIRHGQRILDKSAMCRDCHDR